MIEVFKTNVTDSEFAGMLLDEIHKTFHDYKANFDLEDCDKILRVKSKADSIKVDQIISIVKSFGCQAEVLPDDDQYLDVMMLTKDVELYS